MGDLPEILLDDVRAWADWLTANAENQSGVWLVLAKKGHTDPTSLTYDQALDEALCHGWIDGQLRRRDERTYLQRFTPRRPTSRWSQRNVALAERLIDAGRMKEPGLAQVQRAKADGRWAAAYPGAASIEVPEELARALAANQQAQAAFAALNGANRYAVLYRIVNARGPGSRAAVVAHLVDMLARGQTFHPQSGPEADHREA